MIVAIQPVIDFNVDAFFILSSAGILLEIGKMLVLFPLCPNKVTAIMVVSFLTFSHYRCEIFF
jgi:hypothetical protein